MDEKYLREQLDELLEKKGKAPGIAIFWVDGMSYHVRGEISEFDVLLIAWVCLKRLVDEGRDDLKELKLTLQFIIELEMLTLPEKGGEDGSEKPN